MKQAWKWLTEQVARLFASHKTAIGAVLTSAALAALQSRQGGKVDWTSVGLAAVTTVGALAKSPLTPSQAPPADTAEGGAH